MKDTNPAYIIYPFKGTTRRKGVEIPKQRYGFGINKQREGYVELSGFKKNPKIYGYAKPNHLTINVRLPIEAGRAKLQIGKKIVSVAK